MVANCKLEPQADAALHVIIAALLQARRRSRRIRRTRRARHMRHALQELSAPVQRPADPSAEPEEKR